jgi:AcrR family transcriptional regulator
MPISRNRVNPDQPVIPGQAGRRYGGIDSEERQRQRKAKLIEAGLAVFGEKGFHQATVRDVCKQAGLTSRYFYESFDGMPALFKAVYLSVSRELMQATIMALASCQPDPEKLAEAALRTFLVFVREDLPRARVTLIDVLSIDESMSTLADKATSDFAQLIESLMHQMFPKLGASDHDFRMLAIGLVGANTRIATQWVRERCKAPLEDILRSSLTIFQACIAYARTLEAALPAAPAAR